MRIGEVARLTGTSVRSLRYYEDEGLITPGRDPNGYRDFCASTVESARKVRALIDHGLPTRLVREVLPYLDSTDAVVPDTPCAHLLTLVAQQRDQLDRRIALLTSNRDALDAYLAAAWSAAAPHLT